MRSWKTTTAGVLTVATTIAATVAAFLDGDPATTPDWGAAVGALIAGLGLLFARDNDKSSETVGAK